MTKDWGATGVIDYIPVALDPDTKEQIKRQLGPNAPRKAQLDAFLEAVQDAIRFYHAQRELSDQTKPAVVRANLEAALNAALELEARLQALDGNSRMLIREEFKEGISVLEDRHLGTIMNALKEAAHVADQYPKRGRLPDHARLWLAVDVADALQTHLEIRATSTKEGVFESLLAIILGAATGQAAESVHDLARRALASQKRKGINGETEYYPPEDV